MRSLLLPDYVYIRLGLSICVPRIAAATLCLAIENIGDSMTTVRTDAVCSMSIAVG